jgi:hypothetical protein
MRTALHGGVDQDVRVEREAHGRSGVLFGGGPDELLLVLRPIAPWFIERSVVWGRPDPFVDLLQLRS